MPHVTWKENGRGREKNITHTQIIYTYTHHTQRHIHTYIFITIIVLIFITGYGIISGVLCSFFFKIYLLEHGGGQRTREKESQTDILLSTEPHLGLDPRILRS